MNKVYVIKNWDDIYENNRSKEVKNPSWVPIPNKLYGDGYSLMMEHKDGASIYGAWIALVCIAQRCDPRGTLMRSNGTPHDIASISRITRIKQPVIKLMVEYSVDPLKWLEIQDLQSGAVISQEDATESQEGVAIQDNIGRHNKTQKGQNRDKINFSENVKLTQKEYDKILKEHGEKNTKTIITALCDYKGSTGKKYQSDYKTILSWVIDSVKKKKKYILSEKTYTEEELEKIF